MDQRFDFLVIGSGIAGLFYALNVAKLNPEASIAIITKKEASETGTNRAQGGIAAVLGKSDSFDSHIEDTLRVGCGLSNKQIVESIVENGPKAIEDLIDIGVKFTEVEGELDLGREGGHSSNRVVHALDLTGKEIERALIEACNQLPKITMFPDHIVLDLIKGYSSGKDICTGAYVFSEKNREFDQFIASVTMLATGGLGQVYYHTSNPLIATGDGIAIAYRAGVPIANLEFVQFHPTILHAPGRRPFLLSEAIRGEGGRLKAVDGRYFMEDAHEQKDLAPRDVVARAIDRELKESGEEYVLLEVNHLDDDFIKSRFPGIYEQCLQYGFDITKRSVPVVPAAHYACGGVCSTEFGETDLPGLYVAGEVAMTGMHGANRLASNSLLEAVVMAKFASKKSSEYFKQVDPSLSLSSDQYIHSSLSHPREKILLVHDRRELNRVMSDFVGITRSVERLQIAQEKVDKIKSAIEEYYMATPATYDVIELRNISTVASLIIQSALLRKESRGLHYIEEYPNMDDKFKSDTVMQYEEMKES